MSTTSESTISPPEEDLRSAVAFLKKEHPALGIAKLHALLLSENLSWAVSEKRLRWILKTSNPDGPLTEHQQLEYATTSTPRGPGPSSSPPSTTVSLMRRTFTHRPRSSKVLTSLDGRQPPKTNILTGKRGMGSSRRTRFQRAKSCERKILSP